MNRIKKLVAKSGAEARGIRKALKAVGYKFQFKKRRRPSARNGKQRLCPSCGLKVTPKLTTHSGIKSLDCPECGYQLSSWRSGNGRRCKKPSGRNR